MAEIAVSILAQQLAQVLAKFLVIPLVDRAKMLRDVRGDVQQIKGDLETMLAALQDADQMQSSNQLAKVWVKHVREVAYDAEDIMDDLLCCFGASPEAERGFVGSLWFLCHILTWNRIANQIHGIRRRIHDISERRRDFAVPSTPNNGSATGTPSSFNPRLYAQFVEDSQIVGIDEPKAHLTERLLQGKLGLEVIPVVGMGGVGKTTLVKTMYEDFAVKTHFDCCAWITVSQQFKIIELLRSMIKQFDGEREESNDQSGSMDFVELVKKLRAFLKGKRYVAFIDDIWTEDAWNSIECVFPENELKSRITVTTRSRKVAAYCAKPLENVFTLEPLNDEDAWKLFCKKAFTSDSHDGCPPELTETAIGILSKCRGLPLAIVTLGSLLSTRANILIEWESVHRSLGSELEGSKVMKVLSLSYDNLPSHLKPCFLYFGIYPCSYVIKRAEISPQWVAEGFISPGYGSTCEDVSDRNLKELAQRSLVQTVKLDCFGRVESCQVHDLMHEFILSKSQEQSFHTWMGSHVQARRLAIYSGQNFERETRSPFQIRSLFLFGPNDVPPLAKFYSLKVLSLRGIKLDSFPSCIVDLIHLRYLSLRETNITAVPKSIKKLHNLQTLDLKYTGVSKLPKGIIHLKGLLHLLVCDASGLRGVKLPTKLGKFRAMEKLLLLDVVDRRRQLMELGKLTQLGKLCVNSVRAEDGLALCLSILNMHRLKSLAISSVGLKEFLDLDSLRIASTLRSIKLSGPLVKVPRRLLSHTALVKLQLWHSQLTDDPFQVFQYLPCLMDLRMLDDSYEGEELYANASGFRKLKSLYIGDFQGLKSIKLEKGAMPNLEFWAISGCQQMVRVPLGIEHLNCLKEINLPPKMLSIVSSEKGEDWQKLDKIPNMRQKLFLTELV